jgi:hypothetical protein
MSIFWSIFFVLTLVVVYFAFVRPELAKFKALAGVSTMVGTFETSLKQKVLRALTGLKTVLLGAFGVVTSSLSLLPADVLPGLHDISWGAFVSETTALKITSMIMIVMIVTHAVGLRRAVEAAPRKEG